MSDEAAKKVVEAIRAGDKASLDTLLTSEPGLLEFQAPNGSSVLLLSAYYGHGELAEVFRRHGAMPDIFEACALGDLEAVRELVGGDRRLVNTFAADGRGNCENAAGSGSGPECPAGARVCAAA